MASDHAKRAALNISSMFHYCGEPADQADVEAEVGDAVDAATADLRRELEDARLLATAREHWLYAADGLAISGGGKTLYNGPCELDAHGLPILTDETRAALLAAKGASDAP